MRTIDVSATLEGEQTIGVQHTIHRWYLLPLGIKRDVRLDRRVEVVGLGQTFVGVPTLELVVVPIGIAGLGSPAARHNGLGLNGRAAVGLKLNLVFCNGRCHLASENIPGKYDKDLRGLSTRGPARRLKTVGSIAIVHAAHDAHCGCPDERFHGVAVNRPPVRSRLEGRLIGVTDTDAAPLGKTPHHRGKLLATHGAVRSETALVRTRGVAGHNPGLGTPCNRRGVPLPALDVLKARRASRGTACRSPNDSRNLGASQRVIGGKISSVAARIVLQACHQACLRRRRHPAVVPRALRDILERSGRILSRTRRGLFPLCPKGRVRLYGRIKIVSLLELRVCIPTLEGMPDPEGVVGLCRLGTVLNGLTHHDASAVGFEGHRVRVDCPFSIEGQVCAHRRIKTIGLCTALIRIPSLKGIAGFLGIRRLGSPRAIGNRLCLHGRATVRNEGHCMLAGRPLGIERQIARDCRIKIVDLSEPTI